MEIDGLYTPQSNYLFAVGIGKAARRTRIINNNSESTMKIILNGHNGLSYQIDFKRNNRHVRKVE